MFNLLQCQTRQVESRSKEVCIFGSQKELERHKLKDSKNKKIVLSKYVTFDEASLLKSNVSLVSGEDDCLISLQFCIIISYFATDL